MSSLNSARRWASSNVPFRVLYDANVLYPSYLRDLLIRVAQAGLVHAKWTDRILDETFRSLHANRPDLDTAKLARTRELMCRAVPDCLVLGYEGLIDAVELPDKDDRHVLAAAIKSQAQLIVTGNLKDFPCDVLTLWNLEAQAPDEFLHDLVDLDRQAVYGAVQRIADSMRRPPGTVDDVLASLEREGLVETVAALRY